MTIRRNLKRRGHNIMDKRRKEYNPNTNRDGRVATLHNNDYTTAHIPLVYQTNRTVYTKQYKHYPTPAPKKLQTTPYCKHSRNPWHSCRADAQTRRKKEEKNTRRVRIQQPQWENSSLAKSYRYRAMATDAKRYLQVFSDARRYVQMFSDAGMVSSEAVLAQ